MTETIEEITARIEAERRRKARERQAEIDKVAADLAAKKAKREAEAEKQRRREQGRRVAEAEAKRKADEARLKAEAKRAFVQAGGTLAEFEEQWPALRADLLADRTRRQLDAAKRQAREVARAAFNRGA